MNPTITCTECGAKISLDEALVHQVREELSKDLNKKSAEEAKILEAKLRKELTEEFTKKDALEVEDLKRQLNEKNKKVDEYREQELKLREKARLLEEQKKDIDVEVQRKLDTERDKIQQEVLAKQSESHRLEKAQLQKVIEDMKKEVENAKRKAEQGSQQLQGEVLELDLEDILKRSFAGDDIKPVPKGQLGADVHQFVKTPMGKECGSILWELKRTKLWSDGWVTKLKSDQRRAKADIAVIVSEVMPKGTSGITHVDGVWVTSPVFALTLAQLLRDKFLGVAREKALSTNRGQKADMLYEYVTSQAFIHQVEAVIETYSEMLTQVNKERIAYEKFWSAREKQAQRILMATANVVGNMQGSVGQGMPQIKGLDLELLESGEPEKEIAEG